MDMPLIATAKEAVQAHDILFFTSLPTETMRTYLWDHCYLLVEAVRVDFHALVEFYQDIPIWSWNIKNLFTVWRDDVALAQKMYDACPASQKREVILRVRDYNVWMQDSDMKAFVRRNMRWYWWWGKGHGLDIQVL